MDNLTRYMIKRSKKDFLGREQKTCQVFKCKNKTFSEYAGIVFCRKHFKKELVKNYGSIAKAGKYGFNL